MPPSDADRQTEDRAEAVAHVLSVRSDRRPPSETPRGVNLKGALNANVDRLSDAAAFTH